jgi:hypothetical protein
MIVQLDIALDQEDAAGKEASRFLVRRVKSLLKPAKRQSEFVRKLDASLQKSPEVVVLLGEITALLESHTVH